MSRPGSGQERGSKGRAASQLSGTVLVGFAGLAEAGRTPGRAVCGGGILVVAPGFLGDITFWLSVLQDGVNAF